MWVRARVRYSPSPSGSQHSPTCSSLRLSGSNRVRESNAVAPEGRADDIGEDLVELPTEPVGAVPTGGPLDATQRIEVGRGEVVVDLLDGGADQAGDRPAASLDAVEVPLGGRAEIGVEAPQPLHVRVGVSRFRQRHHRQVQEHCRRRALPQVGDLPLRPAGVSDVGAVRGDHSHHVRGQPVAAIKPVTVHAAGGGRQLPQASGERPFRVIAEIRQLGVPVVEAEQRGAQRVGLEQHFHQAIGQRHRVRPGNRGSHGRSVPAHPTRREHALSWSRQRVTGACGGGRGRP